MNLQTRHQEISKLLKKYLPLFSQWDLDVIKGSSLKHKWIDEVLTFTPEQLLKFDAFRDYKQLNCPEWIAAIEKIENLSHFEVIKAKESLITPLGSKKKQHELKRIASLLCDDKGSHTLDFGGGVGNLSLFLENELDMNMTVLEKDEQLILTGREKQKKRNGNIIFQKHHVGIDELSSAAAAEHDLAIGLHTCGHFANDMLRDCLRSKIPKIVNFGCCYSKIKANDYHLSSASDMSLHFNQRALSCATLGFGVIPKEFYFYRKKIMEYKFSFYHWLFKRYDYLEFCSMSNARRSLYKESFPIFVEKNLTKFFPELLEKKLELDTQSLVDFFACEENKNLNQYFSCYYAISRYFGKLLESYLLCDRALFLAENGYTTEILEVFDSEISPRNKAIIAYLS